MKRINQEEYEVLKELDDKWKWIARDSNTSLWIYKTKPRRFGSSIEWEVLVEGNYHYICGDHFNFVWWEDEKEGLEAEERLDVREKLIDIWYLIDLWLQEEQQKERE